MTNETITNQGRRSWVEARTNVRHGLSHPNGGAQEGISQGDHLSCLRHVDGDDDTGIVGRHSNIAVFGAVIGVGDLEEGPTTG
ncbi:unnamed protein product [Pseudo-nitzschia multistriata]|uniref:Uncharacterized protein n=1 Tax=Pseudo-nitzschia multistriata TaxID=183589 RepID=A0A448ZF74_9STRA|nr:unnamed protein product [Pseudo-nitzschia multistriata]